MIGSLAQHFGWQHDFWHRMGWRELRAWLRERNRQVELANRARTTDPDSWSGYDADGWWAEQERKREQIRGR